MFLFIDTLSDPAYICLFDKKRTIVDSKTWTAKKHEFDTLIESIDTILQQNKITYKGLSGIVALVGPGGFTGTRITTLVANTISYSFHTPLFPLTVGEFFSLQNASLPWITPITKKEVLLWEKNAPNKTPFLKGDVRTSGQGDLLGVSLQNPTIALISDLPTGSYATIAPIDFSSPDHTMCMANNYSEVITGIILAEGQTSIKPLYARDPNITLKKISHGQ